MEWTTEKPTVEGWYWVWDGYSIHMVEVTKHLMKSFSFIVVVDGVPYYDAEFTHFSGPIERPEPPQS